MITLLSLVVLSGLGASDAIQSFPVAVSGGWHVEIGAGQAGGMTLEKAAAVDIAPPKRVSVRDERHASLPVYNPNTGGWARGEKPDGIKTEECSATDRLFPETLRVKSAAGDAGTVFVENKDYTLEHVWGTFGRIEGGAIGANQEVFLDYEFIQDRLDTIALGGAGEMKVFEGTPSLGVVLPAPVAEGFTPIARVWVLGNAATLSDDVLYPVDFNAPAEPKATSPSEAERFLPKTLAKLRNGEPVTLVTFGDSVTCGGGVGADQSLWWQSQFTVRLKERFPTAQLTWKNAGWGGASSDAYMKSPKGSEHDYVRDVLDPKPDLVVIEFVNDAYLDEKGVAQHYGEILGDLRGVGAEVALMTPHLVRPDWMKLSETKVTEDPRPYVRGLREFAAANNVAIADGSARYCALGRQGIPYMSLMTNNINHPDVRGHKLFADALMAMFPEQ